MSICRKNSAGVLIGIAICTSVWRCHHLLMLYSNPWTWDIFPFIWIFFNFFNNVLWFPEFVYIDVSLAFPEFVYIDASLAFLKQGSAVRCFTLLSAMSVLLCISYREEFISALVSFLFLPFLFCSLPADILSLLSCLLQVRITCLFCPEASLILVKLIVFYFLPPL